jgi:2-polyprenyl-6-methoxyphenol hydroxylase-like FAD-dependent oxidoreductase
MTRCEVLIVGAGPTGLVLALWLIRQGVTVRLIDKTAGPGTTSRALDVQARTLELYRQLDLADTIVARGHVTPAIGLWVKSQRVAHLSFEDVGKGLTPYPFLHAFPQDEHEKLLIARLEELGGTVERQVELSHFREAGDGVCAHLRLADGTEETCLAQYIAGCDGAHSVVRETSRIGFKGGDYRQLFYVADVEAGGPAVNGDLNIDFDEADFLGVFPIAGEGRARLIGTVRDERADCPDQLQFADVSARSIEHLQVDVQKVNWFSTYHVHHRVADHFRSGRAFLLGDAAHIHSPAGGQGMNTGIGDAINLAWKLAAVLNGTAADSLLDSYEAERIPFARRLVATTDRVFTFATAEGTFASLLRTRIAPLVLGGITRFEAFREFLFRTVSQVMLNYRDGPLSTGHAGDVHGGDRLPWVDVDGVDNFTPLAQIGWQVHVYGSATAELRNWCRAQQVALHVFGWNDAHHHAGLTRDAAYLLRPDTYVAVVATTDIVPALQGYFDRRQINPSGRTAAHDVNRFDSLSRRA